MGWFEDRFIERDTAVRCACAGCGRSYWLPPSKAPRYKTCSSECASVFRSSARVQRERACETCGATFTPRLGQVRSGRGRFCSQACNTTARLALSSPESQEKARIGWTERNVRSPIHKSGPEHPGWKGGRSATYERLKASGYFREVCSRRSAFAKSKLPRGTVVSLGDRQRWRCVACCADLSDGYHVDHVIPVSKGGPHSPDNVQLLCPPCNRDKSDQDNDEWMKKRRAQLARLEAG